MSTIKNEQTFNYNSFDSDGTITLQKKHPELGSMSFWSHIKALQMSGFNIEVSQYEKATERYAAAKGTLKLELEAILNRQLSEEEYLAIEDKKDIINSYKEYIQSHYAVEGVIDYIIDGAYNGDVSFILTNNKEKNIRKYTRHVGVGLPIVSAYEMGKNKPSPKAFIDKVFADINESILRQIRLGNSGQNLVDRVYSEITKYKCFHFGDSVAQDEGMVRNVNLFYQKLGLLFKITKNQEAKAIIKKIIDNKNQFYPFLDFVYITNELEESKIEKIEVNENVNYNKTTTPTFKTLKEFRSLI